jgi:hypothetical protein
MLLRALFWIGLVSLMLPQEPDLGIGDTGRDAPASSTGHPVDKHSPCTGSCAQGLWNLAAFHALGMRSMDEVSADLDAHRTKF